MAERKVMIGFKTDPEIKERLEKLAYEEDRSISYIVNKLVMRGLEEYDEIEYDTGNEALKILEYVNKSKFSSYSEFIKLAIEENAYEWITENMGAVQLYMIVCEKLKVAPDERMIERFEN